jgi:tetrahydromethanopterin S-methyltransferase subunit F
MAEDEKKGGPIRMAAIDAMLKNIRFKGQIIARTNKLESGIMDMGIIGFTKGVAVSIILVVVPVYLMGLI